MRSTLLTLLMLSILSPLTLSVIAAGSWRSDGDPVQILKKADRATQRVHSIRYHARVWGEGTLEEIPISEGEVAAEATHQPSYPRLRIDARFRANEKDAVERRMVICDGQRALVRKGTKTSVQTARDGLSESRQVVASVWMREFVMPDPFSDELNADVQTYEGRQRIGDTDCHVVYVRYAQRGGEARWYFGMRDYLPRRVDRMMGGGKRVLEVTALALNPEHPPRTFDVPMTAMP